ncbi:WAPL domain-containing protein [Chloropicon primus]|uniref:Wings apart-like protein C-terminal domain-containing protein n=1 Tax=Chloropicon primus TaxID=1764295 RepID=A0A5B8MK00_9CHLO|nr:hypothetical protein A3770_04p32470 [Chloropicon primus]UPQ99941.1 WAPL domain-containing protein [Chloropicon primus]|eukprot:QDZ20729.1 hypothetical protein A3770_04p32470 [Chloropicon primus]
MKPAREKEDPYDFDTFVTKEKLERGQQGTKSAKLGPRGKKGQGKKEMVVMDLVEEARTGREEEATTSYDAKGGGERSSVVVVIEDEDNKDEDQVTMLLDEVERVVKSESELNDLDSLFAEDEDEGVATPAPSRAAPAEDPKSGGSEKVSSEKKRKRRVTFSDKSELKFYEPDVQPKQEAEKSADAIEWGDEVEFALEGLKCSRSTSVALRSAQQLVVLCSSVTQHGYLRDDPDMRESFLEGAAKTATEGCAQGGPEKSSFAMFSSLILHNLVISSNWRLPERQVAPFLDVLHNLLQSGIKSLEASSTGGQEGECKVVACYKRLKSVSKALTLDKSLPTSCQELALPLMIALLILSRKVKAPETMEDSSEYEEMKARLVDSQILADLIRIIVLCHPKEEEAPRGGGKGNDSDLTGQQFWILNHALKVLGSATFLNGQNVSFIENTKLDDKDGGSKMPSFLLSMVEAQYNSKVVGFRECLHASLSVLLNLTHESKGCCKILSGSTDFSGLARIVSDYHYSKDQERSLSDLVNLVLGLLINMAEKDAESRTKLCSLPMDRFSEHEAVEIKSLDKNFVDFIFVVASLGEQAQGQDLETDAEVTVDMLNSSSRSGQKSICQTYSAILLAFLITDDAVLRKGIARLLPGFTLKPLVDAVKSFLDFLTFANALTEKQGDVLSSLIESLKSS